MEVLFATSEGKVHVKNFMGNFISKPAHYPEHIVGQGAAVLVGAGRTGTRPVLQLLHRRAAQLVKCGLKRIAVCYEQPSLVSCNGLPVFTYLKVVGENVHSH